MFETVLHPPNATRGVLLLHGGTGRGDHEAELRERYAQLGYAVFVPDLFEGPPSRELIGSLVAQPELLRQRVVKAHEVLRRREVTTTFVVGHCFGGLAALELARVDATVACAVSFHGNLATPAPASKIAAKILAVTGSADPYCLVEQRAAFEAEMSAAGADWQLLVLGGAKHGFTVKSSPDYDAQADRRSWDAMLKLFAEIS
ncbi:MAG: alpha/beta fold hydrolase [Kofleriaceae bacterium]